jgi:hypothetical protein
MPLSALTSTTARYEKAGFAKLVDASATRVLIWRSPLASPGKTKLAAAVVQLDGPVLIWHMFDWVSTACCLYLLWGAFKK